MEIDARDLAAAAAGLELVDELAGGVLGDSIDTLGAAALVDVRRGASRHRRTGRLLDQIVARQTGEGIGTVVTVSSGGSIAPIITGGSVAHVIGPVRARALALGARSHGGSVRSFAAAVRHPGTRADPYVERALGGSLETADHELELAGDRIAGAIADTMEG